MNWHSVSENPKDNVPLLVAKCNSLYTDYATATFMNNKFMEYDSDYLLYEHKNVTHWTYITPPEE